MPVRMWILVFLAIGALGGIAQAGKPPNTPADARTVSGLETGDAGQTIKPPPSGASATVRPFSQTNGGAPVQAASLTAGSTLVICCPFFICIVPTDPPAAGRSGNQR